MNSVNDLMGGDQQEDLQGFVDRYEHGHPSEGYGDQEAISRHDQVAQQLSPEDYHQAAQQAFDRMSPDERMQFGQHLQEQAQQQGYNDPNLDNAGSGDLQDAGFLAQTAQHMQQQQPGMLGQLLTGGGPGGMAGGSGSLLGNPAAKSALAGIASFAAKKLMNQ
ncbi:MAG: hypothetical protein NVSMB22_17600 [Chloroflexota bacterium]